MVESLRYHNNLSDFFIDYLDLQQKWRGLELEAMISKCQFTLVDQLFCYKLRQQDSK
jgi:hypothetical protein